MVFFLQNLLCLTSLGFLANPVHLSKKLLSASSLLLPKSSSLWLRISLASFRALWQNKKIAINEVCMEMFMGEEATAAKELKGWSVLIMKNAVFRQSDWGMYCCWQAQKAHTLIKPQYKWLIMGQTCPLTGRGWQQGYSISHMPLISCSPVGGRKTRNLELKEM